MPRPEKYNLDGISPIRGHEFFEKKAHNKAYDAWIAYLSEIGVELPVIEEIVEKKEEVESEAVVEEEIEEEVNLDEGVE